jgi:GT2 family glycosyltransferase
MSKLSVITLTYNKLACTKRCLPSLLQSDCQSWELIVVENGSTDGTLEWLKWFQREAEWAGVKVTILASPTNIGCSTARNQAIAASVGERIVFVDNDVALRNRNWLEKLGQVLDTKLEVGIVGPKLVYPFPPHRIQFAGGAVSRTGRVQFMGRGEAIDDPRFNTRRECQYFISACFMIRRDALLEAGGFDEAYNPVQFEDTDLCYKVRRHGHRILYEPSVEMYHFESVTTAGTPSLANTAIVVRHGLLFKERWKAMFEKEDGPSDADIAWKKIAIPPLESIPEPPVV